VRDVTFYEGWGTYWHLTAMMDVRLKPEA
jgi:hypothetical protein